MVVGVLDFRRTTRVCWSFLMVAMALFRSERRARLKALRAWGRLRVRVVIVALLVGEDGVGWSRALQGGLAPAVLALDVLSKKNGMVELVEIARVTGMMLQHIYIRGQMARVSSLLQVHATRQGVVIPTTTEGLLDKTQLNRSALLLDPSLPTASNPEAIGTVGMHTDPVAVLDFKSLYPSIMIEHNLCYSTLVKEKRDRGGGGAAAAGAKKEEEGGKEGGEAGGEVFTTPIGAQFVQMQTRHGIFPSLLSDLIQARHHAQAELKQAGISEAASRVLNARQKALKLAANACYGRCVCVCVCTCL